MPRNSRFVPIPADLGTRLRALFCLSSAPKNLRELAELVREHNRKCVRDPRLKVHFEAISNGEEIFGRVGYKLAIKSGLPAENSSA